jgi:hypothetical protein
MPCFDVASFGKTRASVMTLALAGLLLLTSCKTRQWQQSTSRLDQDANQSAAQSNPVWDDTASPKELEEKAPKIYFSLYDRYRENPNGNFAVPEFAPQATKVVQILNTVAQRLKRGEFPLAVSGSPSENIAKRALATLKTSITPECFSAATQRILPLLEPAPPAQLTYAYFWDAYRLASQAMKDPCALLDRLNAKQSDKGGGNSLARWTFLPFPAIQVPVVGAESDIEHFNALLPLPIHIIGLSDSVGWVDKLFMDPAAFVGHDFAHAFRLFGELDRDKTLGPIFKTWTGADMVALKLDLRSVELSLIDYMWKLEPWADLAGKSQNAAALQKALEPRLKASRCVRSSVNQHPKRAELHNDLFKLFHEEVRHIPLLGSEPAPFWEDEYPDLAEIIASCKKQT